MDAFYASIEQRDQPELRGQPVAVGGKPPRGVVAAASYEARRFGVKSAMATAIALKRCPELRVVSPRMSHYVTVSRQIFDIFRSLTPLVEPLSLDEAFLDLTGTETLMGSPRDVATQIKQRVREATGLVVSVGGGPNKLIAKIASDMDKPDGLLIVEPAGVQDFLDPLPVGRLFGVGRRSEKVLHQLGCKTITELRRLDAVTLCRHLGSFGEALHRMARGEDDRPVASGRQPKSLGAEETFESDLDSLQALRPIVRRQAMRVAKRLRKAQLRARVVTVKIKTPDHQIHTHQLKLTEASWDDDAIANAAVRLLRTLLKTHCPIRLAGVSTSDFVAEDEPAQLSFDLPQRQEKDRLLETIDALKDRFGETIVRRGT